MTKSYMKRYILKYQNDIDERVLEEYPELPYSEEELNEMNYKEMKVAFTDLVKAEDETYKLYDKEVIRHGRSE